MCKYWVPGLVSPCNFLVTITPGLSLVKEGGATENVRDPLWRSSHINSRLAPTSLDNQKAVGHDA